MMGTGNADNLVFRSKSQRGSALILAMWSMILLSTFAVELGMIVRQKLTLMHRLDDRDLRFRIAEAGVKYSITQLKKHDTLFNVDFLAERWSDQEGYFKEIRVGKGKFTVSYTYKDSESTRVMYGMQDEESKININKADEEVIIRLLRITTDLNRRETEELAYSIVDWRDKDSFFQHPQYGAEDSDYRARINKYESKDSDYEVIEELLLVNKMDQKTFDQIRPFVTIFGNGKVNINTAPVQVLLALGVQKYVVDNIILFRKGGDQVAGTGDDDIFLQTSTIVSRLSQMFDMSPSEIASLSNLVAAGQFTTVSENFMIRCTAELDYQSDQMTITAVSDRSGKIKYWREEV